MDKPERYILAKVGGALIVCEQVIKSGYVAYAAILPLHAQNLPHL